MLHRAKKKKRFNLKDLKLLALQKNKNRSLILKTVLKIAHYSTRSSCWCGQSDCQQEE